jgi:hypothetical protein
VFATNAGDLLVGGSLLPEFDRNAIRPDHGQTVSGLLWKTESVPLNIGGNALEAFPGSVPVLARDDQINVFGRSAGIVQVKGYSAGDSKWNRFAFQNADGLVVSFLDMGVQHRLRFKQKSMVLGSSH